MPLDQLTPEVWAGQLLKAFRTKLVYAQDPVVNTDYEGEIAAVGDQVHVVSVGAPSIFNYVKNVDMAAPETLTDAETILTVDQAKAYNFVVDSIDAKQNKYDAQQEGVSLAGYGMAQAVDAYVSSLYTDVAPANTTGSDASPITGGWTSAGTQMYDRLVDLGVSLDNADVPDEGRWVVLPPWALAYIDKDDRFIKYGGAQQEQRLINGFEGRIAGFDVYKSNRVPNTAGLKYKILAGVKSAISFAGNLTETDTYSPERRFGLGHKGLYVFGAKVMRPDALALLIANPT